jgi:hypothetical protein
MGFSFKDFSNWGNISGEKVVQGGPSAKNTDGDSYSTQTGNSTSKQWGNKNAFQHGVSNSVLVGMSFSTNVAATFSTTIGAACSMQAALSVAGFIGPKFSVNKSWELSASWAEKYVWVKSENEYVKKEGKYELVNKDEKFATDANRWLGTENVVAKDEIRKVLDGDMSYVKLTTSVASQDAKTVGGSHRVTAAMHKFTATSGGSITVAPVVSISGSQIKLIGPVINIG